jgi:uncharacterized membrane protein
MSDAITTDRPAVEPRRRGGAVLRFLLGLGLALAVGLVGAAIVHIAVVLLVPRMADNNAWGRLSRTGEMFTVARVEPLREGASGPAAQAEGSERQDFAFIDPAFATVSCRFSLADGPVRLYADGETEFWSASIYSREGDNLYSINNRAAVDGLFDLLVGTSEQILEARADVDAAEDTAIPVAIPVEEGYLTLRALVREESARPLVDLFTRTVVCEPATAADQAG